MRGKKRKLNNKASGVKLVPFTRQHARNTLSWVNDREIMLMMNRVKLIREDEHFEWYKNVISNPKTAIFAIETDGNHIGNCCLKNINADGRSKNAELWIYIGDKTAQGKGYGEKTMRLLLDYGFRNLNLHRIYLYVVDYNQRACELYKKLGFKDEGRKREHIFIGNKYRDSIEMGILRKEWVKK